MRTTETRNTYSGFWPVALVCVSLVVLLGWNLFSALQQNRAGSRLQEQQQAQIGQAAEMEGRLKALMADLIELAKVDPAADGVLKKFNIAMTPQAAPATPAAPAAATPAE